MFNLVLRHLEVVLLLEGHHHPTEVLTDEVDNELVASVAVSDVVLSKDLIGEIRACFERKLFGEDQGVVTVEQEVFDLFRVSQDSQKARGAAITGAIAVM